MQVWGKVQQYPELWLPSLSKGFPLYPGTEKELRKLQIGVVGALVDKPTIPTKQSTKKLKLQKKSHIRKPP